MRLLTYLSLFISTLVSSLQAEQPNILFVLSDDESALERRAYGWSNFPTPNFEKMASEGILFTNAHTNVPSCAPARASILSGRYFWELGEGAFINAWFPKEHVVFTDLLEEAGYQVGRTGKGWYPGLHPEEGHPEESAGLADDSVKLPKVKPGISDIDYAANFDRFIETSKKDQPFFYWLGIKEPHSGWDSENYQLLKTEFGVDHRELRLPDILEDNEGNRKEYANYLYEVAYCDDVLGESLDVLEKHGLSENTIVVYTSDNGGSQITDRVPEGIEGKGKARSYMWGTHEPMAIRWPAVIQDERIVSDFVNFADLAPTFLELAGVDSPDVMTGKSFVDVLKSTESGRIDPSRNAAFTGLEWHGEMDPLRHTFRAIRSDNYSLILRYDNDNNTVDGSPVEPSKIELYDYKEDVWELNNLADDPEYKGVKEALHEELVGFGQKTADPRMTGDMDHFRVLRRFMQERKKSGYGRMYRKGTWSELHKKTP